MYVLEYCFLFHFVLLLPFHVFDSSLLFTPLSFHIGDFEIVRTGDPLFVSLHDNEIIYYDGSYGDAVHLIFINEGGYYYSSSGSGIAAFMNATCNLYTGLINTKL